MMLITLLLFNSCSKSSTGSKATTTNSVSINGTAYPTAVIAKQTWTTTNYSGDGGGLGLYTFAQAEAISLPTGWRLPTKSDYNGLLELAGGIVNSDGYVLNANALELMSKSTWSGNTATNSLGFNATSSGFATTPGTELGGQGNNATIWSSSSDVPGEPLALIISLLPPNPAGAILDKWYPQDYAAVRFVKDN